MPRDRQYEAEIDYVLDCPRRIDRALSVLAKLNRLPDAGTHLPDCWLTDGHTDCLAELLESILRGEAA